MFCHKSTSTQELSISACFLALTQTLEQTGGLTQTLEYFIGQNFKIMTRALHLWSKLSSWEWIDSSGFVLNVVTQFSYVFTLYDLIENFGIKLLFLIQISIQIWILMCISISFNN